MLRVRLFVQRERKEMAFMPILITGGAGYIGSHTAGYFKEKGDDVIVADSLKNGHREAIPDCRFYHGDIRDRGFTDRIFRENDIEAVVHFAADSIVSESMDDPLEYYDNNVCGMVSLLEAMKEHDVKKIIFSSSAAVYGEPDHIPVTEEHDTVPENTYGETKLAMEKMMKWCSRAYDISYVSLRYFNACGAHPLGSMGEDHFPETHLIPLILQVPLGRRDRLMIYGDDHDTPDGTCIRDYVHVMDLAAAHHLALEYLRSGGASDVFNLGSGRGYSVKEILDAARRVTANTIPAEVTGRRAGDPSVLVASSEKAKKVLGWVPQHDSIEQMISDAWRWHASHPDGYR